MNFRGILIAKERIRYNLFIMVLPTLDAHAHFDPSRSSLELSEAEAVIATTLSMVEAAKVIERQEPLIAWGVGCHPRKLVAHPALVDRHCLRDAAGGGAGLLFLSTLSSRQALEGVFFAHRTSAPRYHPSACW